jgi:hypothetical protein
MNTECLRIAEQLRRAFAGDAFHGSSLKELLADVTPEQAKARPITTAHSIWELVSHIEVWTEFAAQAAKSVPMPDLSIIGTDKDWPPVTDATAEAWAGTLDRMFQASLRLSQLMEGFADDRLQETVPGRQYNFHSLFDGIVQHSLYHAGQIALLKKAT